MQPMTTSLGWSREAFSFAIAVQNLVWGAAAPFAAWLADRWTARWGREKTVRLMEANNTPARTFARVNTLVAEPEKLIAAWRAEEVEYDFGRWDWIPENLVIQLRSQPPNATQPTLRKGWFTYRPTTSWRRATGARPRSHRPLRRAGGKTTLLAQMLENDAQLVAVEPAPERRERLEENCDRLNAD
jgi:16S rRNA C967 or C1407 C5-methylase (RsmB/RsmF family)